METMTEKTQLSTGPTLIPNQALHFETTATQSSISNLYVHFPFCESKCHYCDFFSLPENQFKTDQRARVYAAIHRELEFHLPQLANSLKTVFLGGGTPSLVPLEILEDFMSRLNFDSSTEITIEANPSSITLERARAWKSFGINRVSMGTQALNDQNLKWLGRVHSRDEIFKALTDLFNAGFRNVSTDYIVGVHGQTTAMIEDEINELVSSFPHIKHISAYLLTLKPSNSKFKQLPSEEEQLQHLQKVSEVLGGHGFQQYEISNFAREGQFAKHNENYWLGGGYLGIGPSAHSFWPDRRERTKNWASLGKYCELVESKEPPIEWVESLSHEQERLEYLMLRLRRKNGIDLTEYRQLFGRDLYSDKRAWIDTWHNKGLVHLDRHTGWLRLTRDGFFLSDQILNNIS